MLAESRRLQIIDFLSSAGNGVVSVSALAQALGVSEMTVRRDLNWLEQHSILTRVHGGAIAFRSDATQAQDEKPFGIRLNDASPQKKSIGWAAAELVQDGDRIILDAGTTTQQVARNLGNKNKLTVITNNIPISAELSRYEQIETILLGGHLKHQELCTIGPMVKQALAILSVDKCFLSAAGFTIQHGASDPDMREVEVKQAMIQASGEVILVADSSKYGVVALVKICLLKSVHKIVTDDAISSQAVAELEAEGIQVITPQRTAQKRISSLPE